MTKQEDIRHLHTRTKKTILVGDGQSSALSAAFSAALAAKSSKQHIASTSTPVSFYKNDPDTAIRVPSQHHGAVRARIDVMFDQLSRSSDTDLHSHEIWFRGCHPSDLTIALTEITFSDGYVHVGNVEDVDPIDLGVALSRIADVWLKPNHTDRVKVYADPTYWMTVGHDECSTTLC